MKKLPAGPELDAEVHRAVFGVSRLEGVIPAYSTDSAAAWRVIEHMMSRECYWWIGPRDDGTRRLTLYGSHGLHWSYGVTAAELPYAICAAALEECAYPSD